MATPFTIKIDQSILDDLKRRLQNTRFPDQITGSGWEYGTEPSCLQARAGSQTLLLAVHRHACTSLPAFDSMIHAL